MWHPWPSTECGTARAFKHLQGQNFKHFWGAILKKLTFHFSFVVYYDACIVFKVEKHTIFSPIWLPLSYDHRRMHCGQRECSAQREHSWRDPEKPWLLHWTFALSKIGTLFSSMKMLLLFNQGSKCVHTSFKDWCMIQIQILGHVGTAEMLPRPFTSQFTPFHRSKFNQAVHCYKSIQRGLKLDRAFQR